PTEGLGNGGRGGRNPTATTDHDRAVSVHASGTALGKSRQKAEKDHAARCRPTEGLGREGRRRAQSATTDHDRAVSVHAIGNAKRNPGEGPRLAMPLAAVQRKAWDILAMPKQQLLPTTTVPSALTPAAKLVVPPGKKPRPWKKHWGPEVAGVAVTKATTETKTRSRLFFHDGESVACMIPSLPRDRVSAAAGIARA